MPTTLTESNTFDATIPTPNDAEAANAASVRQAFQPLANRTNFLHARVGNGDNGVALLRSKSAASMSALTIADGVADGSVCLVNEVSLLSGIFVYRVNSLRTVDNRLVYAATGMASVGRWEHSMIDLLGLAGGVEFCRSHQKSGTAASLTTTSTSETTLASIGMGTLVAGDVVTAYWDALVSCVASYNVDVYVSENGGGDSLKTIVNAYAATAGAGSFVAAGIGFTHVVGTGGTFSIKIKGRTTNAANQLNVYLLPYIIKAVKP